MIIMKMQILSLIYEIINSWNILPLKYFTVGIFTVGLFYCWAISLLQYAFYCVGVSAIGSVFFGPSHNPC